MEQGPSLNVIIGANLDKLHKEMQHATGVMHEFQENMEEMGTKLIAAFALEQLGEKVFEFGKESVMAVAALEDNLTRMKFALRGNVSEMSELQEYAEKLSKTTWFDDDDLIKQETRLTVMGRSVDQIKDILGAATAMSSALPDVDLATAVDALNKSLNGVGKTLINLDPSFKGLTEEQLKNGEAIKLATSKYGDLAQELNNNTNAAIRNASKEWEDFGKNLAKTEFVKAAANAAGSFFHSLSVNIAGVKDENDKLKDLNEAIRNYNQLKKEGAQGNFLKDAAEELDRAAKEANKVIVNFHGQKKWFNHADLKKKEGGGGENEEVTDLGTIEGIEKRIKELREEQMHAHGKAIHSIEEEIELLQKKEKLLKSGEGIKAIEGQFDKYQKGIKTVREEMDKLAQAAHNATHKNTTLEDTFEKMEKTLQKIASGKGIVTVVAGYEKATKQFEKLGLENKKHNDEMTKEAARAGSMIGDEMGKMISSQASFAESMASITEKMIREYALKAIAAAGAGGAESGGPAAVATAAIAMAAMAALFSSFGISSHGSGGGSSVSRAADARPSSSMQMPGLNLRLEGDFRLQGNQLVSAIRKANYYADKTGG